MATTVVDELVTVLGLKMSPGAGAIVGGFTTMMGNLHNMATKVTTGLTAAGVALGGMFAAATHTGAEIYKLSDILEESSEELQRWGFAMLSVGGNTAQGMDMIKQLETHMKSLNPGEYMEIAARFGLNPDQMKKGSELALAIAERFHTMTKQEKLNLAGKFGLDDNGLRLLGHGREQVEKLLASTPKSAILNDKDLKNSMNLSVEWGKINLEIRRTVDHLLMRFSPVVLSILKDLEKWFNKLSTSKLEKFLDAVGKGVKLFWQELVHLIKEIDAAYPGIREFISNLMGAHEWSGAVKTVLWLLVAAFVAVNAKIILVSLAITGIIALFAEMKKGTQDSGEAVSEWSKTFDDFEKKYPHIADLMGRLKNLWKETMDFWVSNKGAEVFKSVLSALDSVFDKMLKVYDFGSKILTTELEFMRNPAEFVIGGLRDKGLKEQQTANGLFKNGGALEKFMSNSGKVGDTIVNITLPSGQVQSVTLPRNSGSHDINLGSSLSAVPSR